MSVKNDILILKELQCSGTINKEEREFSVKALDGQLSCPSLPWQTSSLPLFDDFALLLVLDFPLE